MMISTLATKTIAHVLAARGEQQADAVAYVYLADGERASRSITFGELHTRAASIGRELSARHLRGERALLLYLSELDFVPAFLGCLYAGVIAVPCPYPGRSRNWSRIVAIAEDCKPLAVLTSSEGLERVQARVQTGDWPASREIVLTDMIADCAGSEGPVGSLQPIAFLQYTSGSTSRPRGVVMTHHGLMHNEAMIMEAFAQTKEDVIASWLPLHHDMGLIGSVLQPLYVGSRCILMPATAFLQRPARWLEAITRFRVTTSGAPNFAWDLCAKRVSEEDLRTLDLSSWRLAFNGAEPVRPSTMDNFVRRFASVGFARKAFQPCYGLAEATLLVATGPAGREPVVMRFDRSELEAARAQPVTGETKATADLAGCGQTWRGQHLRIVDPGSGAELPQGRVGEVQVSGESVAEAYWNDSVQSEETFVRSGDGIWLRTGDLGFQISGELFIAGRLKDLIIVRGRNLYPQDLEQTASAAHEALQPGAGAAFAVEGDEGEAVVLVQERRRNATATAEHEIFAALREAIAREFEVQLLDLVLLEPGKLPMTSSGKVRRSFCRSQYLEGVWRSIAQAASAVGTSDAFVPGLPSELTNSIRNILSGSLPLEHPHCSLAEAGLDSLRAVQLAQQLERRRGVQISAADLLDMTFGELAGKLGAGPINRSEAQPAKRSLAVTPGQKTLLTLDALAQGASPNNLYAACWVEGPVEAQALLGAADRLVQRHAVLRSTLAGHDAELLVEHQELRADAALVDLSELDEAALRRWLTTEGGRRFDLVRGPLLRLRLCHCGAARTMLLVVLHHLAGDLRSLEIILNELGVLYEEAAGGVSPELPQAAAFAEFAAEQRDWLEGDAAKHAWAFWREQMAEPPVLHLPYDFPRPSLSGLVGATVRYQLSAARTTQAAAAARGLGSTLYVYLLSTFQAFLHRYTGDAELVVGSPFLGRDRAKFAETVGYFTNPLPLRATMADDPKFEILVRRNTKHVRDVMRHAELPGALLAQQCRAPGDAASPMYRAYFVFEQAGPGHANFPAVAIGVPGVSLEIGPLRMTSIGTDQSTAQFDLLLYAAEHNGLLHLALNYDTELFERRTVEDLLESFGAFIASVVQDADKPLSELEMLTSKQRNDQLSQGNPAVAGAAVNDCLYERFEAVARQHPDAVAVIDGVHELTYGELRARCRLLAATLQEAGVGPESRVPLLLPPGANQIIAILAVLAAGAAYVPLDLQHPVERLAYIVRDVCEEDVPGGNTPAVFVVEPSTQSKAAAVCDAARVAINILDLSRSWTPAQIDRPAEVKVQNAAYIIYTSGSTGTPKGVVNTHANVLRLFAATQEQFRFSAADTWTLFHSYAFDFSVWEIWGALLHGGKLVIVSPETRHSPRQFYNLLRSESVTILCQTPSAFRQLIEIDEAWGRLHGIALRVVIFGGEALERGCLAAWLRAYECAPPDLVNMYGITETTVHVTYHRLQRREVETAGRSMIGNAIEDLQVYLLDAKLNLLPPGAVGEIFVGGPGLARGYHDRPGLTAERFVPNPFSGKPGDRLYRSGDLARYSAHGNLEYLGRADEQVKIRGYRIELGEIQQALSLHPQVAGALVLADRDSQGETRLIAYVCGPGLNETSSNAPLRAYLAERLPSYMLPAAFVTVPFFSLTTNGKIDRTALPSPDVAQPTAQISISRSSTTEAALGLIWTEVLGGPQPSKDDDFFALGGHSLLVMKTVRRIREVFEVDLPMAQAFRSSSLMKMAAAIDGLLGRPLLPSIVRGIERDWFPLSFAQERVWVAEQLYPGTSLFNIPIAVVLTAAADRALLQRSLQLVVDRHEVLRTAFVETSSGPSQRVLAHLEVAIEETAVGSAKELAKLAEEDGRRVFALRAPPLFRFHLVHQSSERHVLLMTIHHIVFDLWSAAILLRELLNAYSALEHGLPEPESPLPIQYGDFALWERSALVRQRMGEQAAFWKRELSGADPGFTVPLDRPRPETPSTRGGVEHLRLDQDLHASLHTLRSRHGVTLYVLLLTVFKVLLHRISKKDDVLVGTDVAVREIDKVELLIGMFVNQIPLRTELHLEMQFGEALRRVENTTTRAWANRNVPAQHIGRPPLFRVLFDLQNFDFALAQQLPVSVRRLEMDWTTAKHDVSLFMEEEQGELTATLEYSTDVLTGRSASTLLSQYVRLLEQVVSDPELQIGSYALLDQEAEQGLANAFNEELEWQGEVR